MKSTWMFISLSVFVFGLSEIGWGRQERCRMKAENAVLSSFAKSVESKMRMRKTGTFAIDFSKGTIAYKISLESTVGNESYTGISKIKTKEFKVENGNLCLKKKNFLDCFFQEMAEALKLKPQKITKVVQYLVDIEKTQPDGAKKMIGAGEMLFEFRGNGTVLGRAGAFAFYEAKWIFPCVSEP